MAKKQRFPSDANKPKPTKDAAPSAPKAVEPKDVQGTKQDLIQVQYTKDNHHVLGIGAHALRNGINHLPRQVWEDAQKHPSVQSMLKSGHLVDLSVDQKDESPAELDGEELEDEGSEDQGEASGSESEEKPSA